MESKKWFIYMGKEKIEVTEEVYREYYRPNWKTQSFARRHNLCSCLSWRKCIGDCGLCEYRTDGDFVSMQFLEEEHGIAIADKRGNPEEIICNSVMDDILRELNDIHQSGGKIAQLLMEGKTDRQIAEILGMPKSTYNDLKKRIRKELRKRLKDIL